MISPYTQKLVFIMTTVCLLCKNVLCGQILIKLYLKYSLCNQKSHFRIRIKVEIWGNNLNLTSSLENTNCSYPIEVLIYLFPSDKTLLCGKPA